MMRRTYMRRWKKRNPDKVRGYARASYRRNPLIARDKALRRKFGITLQVYEAMRAAQKNRCAICVTRKPGGKGDWHVDHDHKTKRIRGLLCQNCNFGLGNFRDSPTHLRAAVNYLHR